ncbi:hypothetical protein ACLBR5_16675 [Escherichia coli]
MEKHYGRPMDIEWGERWPHRQTVHCAGASGNRALTRSGHGALYAALAG